VFPFLSAQKKKKKTARRTGGNGQIDVRVNWKSRSGGWGSDLQVMGETSGKRELEAATFGVLKR